jgi:glutamine cyclotransferase
VSYNNLVYRLILILFAYTVNVLNIVRVLLLPLLLMPLGCSNVPEIKPKEISYNIVKIYPHDSLAFTQGLAWDEGIVYEGTGLHGKSSLRQVNLETGETILKIDYQREVFAEGIAVFKNLIYQLTWKNKTVFIYNKHDLSLVKSLQYSREGWGITHDNKSLILSDGTSTLYFLDPENLGEKKRISVSDSTSEVQYLNELEYINDKIYANIWKSNRIAIINPSNGIVDGWLDLSSLREQLEFDKKVGVLNGIMYDQKEERLFVTGKLWPALYEIKLIPN